MSDWHEQAAPLNKQHCRAGNIDSVKRETGARLRVIEWLSAVSTGKRSWPASTN